MGGETSNSHQTGLGRIRKILMWRRLMTRSLQKTAKKRRADLRTRVRSHKMSNRRRSRRAPGPVITKPGEGELGKQTEMSDSGVSRQSRDITMLQFTTQQYRHYLDVTHPAEFLLIIINLLWIVINTKNVIIFVLIPRQPLSFSSVDFNIFQA